MALFKLEADWSALSHVSHTSVKSIMCRGLWELWARPPSVEVILLLCLRPSAAEGRLLSSRHVTADVLSARSLQLNLESFVGEILHSHNPPVLSTLGAKVKKLSASRLI